MDKQVEPALAEAGTNTAETDILKHLLGEGQNQEPDMVTETEEPQPEVEPEEAEGEALDAELEATEDEAEGEDNVLSKLGIDDLSPEDFAELADAFKANGASKRVKQILAKQKATEAELNQLRAAVQNQQQNPLDQPVEVADNPYADIPDYAGLGQKAKEVDAMIEWAEDLLDGASDYADSDVLPDTQAMGKEMTKGQLKAAKREAMKAKRKFLPARLQELQQTEQIEVATATNQAKLEKALPWMNDEESDIKKLFDSYSNWPLVERMIAAVPEAKAYLPTLLGYATAYEKHLEELSKKPKAKAAATRTSARMQPPTSGSPSSSASLSERPSNSNTKKRSQAHSKWDKSGDSADLEAYLISM